MAGFSLTSGFSGNAGLWSGFSGLWSGATGFALGGGSAPTFYFELEDGSGSLLLESGDYLLLETA